MYLLTIEPHTPFDAAVVLAGELEEPGRRRGRLRITQITRARAGIRRLLSAAEVASYARPGFGMPPANIAYWTGVSTWVQPFGCHDDAERAASHVGEGRPGDRRPSTRARWPPRTLCWACMTAGVSG